MSSSCPLSHRQTITPIVVINIYAKQKKPEIVDVIFDESAPIELSYIISDFIDNRFNHLPMLFTIPQLKRVCSKVRQLSTNALVETVLTKLKYKPCQNQAQLRDLSESMERIRKEKLFKPTITFNPLPKISTEKDLKEKEIVEKIEDIEEDDESDTK
jgi:hypothetical protein